MQLYFIRHGQSENNARWNGSEYTEPRSPDPELTDTGQRQAEIAARFLARGGAADITDAHNLAGFGITHLYSSLMVRAVASGTVIARALSLPLVAWPDLHEVGGIVRDDDETGEHVGLPGNSRAFFERRFPALVLPEALDDTGWWNRPFEEREERLPRAQGVVEELRRRHAGADDRVAIVSHGGFYNYVMAAMLNLPSRDGYWFTLNNCAISRFDFTDDGLVGVAYTNRADFLPPELIT